MSYPSFLTFLLLFIIPIDELSAQSKVEKYHQILIQNHQLSTEQQLMLDQMPFLHDCGSAAVDKHHSHPFILSESEILHLQKAQIPYVYQEKDMQAFYQKRLAKSQKVNNSPKNNKSAADISCKFVDYPLPQHFSLGSMGGFATYEEILAHLDHMKSLYPDLITTKQAITDHPTHDGNYVYWVKISDHAEMDEAEPQAMYTALHHAREPMSMMQMIYFMYYLLENYETDETVKYLVDERELFFFPCINPDGYLYNQEIAPEGGGLWRKNRSPNEDGSFGVDLNRNYGYSWAYDDVGSSSNPEGQTYRGTAAFSEPELRAVRDFCNDHEVKICLNYHAYGELLIHPWGYADLQPAEEDRALFNAYSQRMTWHNRYKYGNGVGAINYYANGDSDDWMYAEVDSKGKIIAFTPEVGTTEDGFWPETDRIIPLCQAQMLQNLEAAHYAGNYLVVDYLQEPWLADRGIVKVDVLNLGLSNTGDVKLSFLPDEQLSFLGSSFSFPPLNTGERIAFGLSYDVVPLSEPLIELGVKLEQGSFAQTTTYQKAYQPTIVFEDDFENGRANWLGNWDISDAVSANGQYCLTDSPNDIYAPDITDEYTYIAQKIDLRNTNRARLTFLCKWNIERRYDEAEVVIRTDPEAEWQSLCGNYNKPPSRFQKTDSYIYDGLQIEWVQEEIVLDDYTGQEVEIGFRLGSDPYEEKDGFFVDDVAIFKWQDDQTDVQVKVFLEGCYDSESQLMTNQLADKFLLPSTQPYNNAFWAYNGLEIEGAINDFAGNDQVIDWVLVEVRAVDDLTKIVDRQVAFLGADGFLSSVDGHSILTFQGLPPNKNFHLFIRHRNHVDIMSSQTFQAVNGLVDFDFTTASTTAFGENQLKAVDDNTFVLIVGDINGDGTITLTDYNAYLSKTSIINQYLPEDMNLDGVISVGDFNLLHKNVGHLGTSAIRY